MCKEGSSFISWPTAVCGLRGLGMDRREFTHLFKLCFLLSKPFFPTLQLQQNNSLKNTGPLYNIKILIIRLLRMDRFHHLVVEMVLGAFG